MSDAQSALVHEARAKPLSYDVRLLRSSAPDGRLLVVLGEAHLKFSRAAELGERLVDAFAMRGVETFQTRKVFLGRLLMILIVVPRLLLRALTLGLLRGSTITYAVTRRHGHTVELEKDQTIPLSLHLGALHLTMFFAVSFAVVLLGQTAPWLSTESSAQTLLSALWPVALAMQRHLVIAAVPAFIMRKRAHAWLIFPMLAILTERDRLMVVGTLRLLSTYPSEGPVLVIMGRAHVAGYERRLVSEHGFVRAVF